MVRKQLAAAFAGDHDLVGGAERFAAEPGVDLAVVGDAELDVPLDEGIENGVGNLVGDLVRMALGHGFAGEKVVGAGQSGILLQGRALRPRRANGGCGFCSVLERGQDVGSRGQTLSVAIPAGRGASVSALSSPRDLLDQIDDPAAQLGVLDPHEGFGQRKPVGGRKKVGRHRPATALPRVLPAETPARLARLRRRTTPALAGCARSAAAGWRRSGSRPSRISAPAETSVREHRRASPDSFPASSDACVPSRPHACQWGWAPSSPSC